MLAAAVLAACGGGGGGTSSSALPPVLTGPTGGGVSAPQPVSLSIAIPAATASSIARRTRYVSAGTKSIAVSYGSTAQTADCATTCSMTLQVLPGTVTFTVTLYDALGGKGNVLSTGQTTTTITTGAVNRVALVFGGVVAALAVMIVPGSVPAGTAASVPVTVQAKDAAGYTIVGSDAYVNPVQLSNDDGSGATSLSTTTVTGPGTNVTLNYNGSASASAAHVTATVSATGVRSQAATLAVQPQAPPPPPGNAPTHIASFYFYGQWTAASPRANGTIPAAWMAAHADYVEEYPPYGAQFKAAGGKHVVSYTDSAYVPYCVAPFKPPAGPCKGPLGPELGGVESAWLHSADGSRVNHSYPGFDYQEVLNPTSPAVQTAYHNLTAALVAERPEIDYFFADDSGGEFIGPDGTVMSGGLYGFSAPAVEITTNEQFIPANKAMMAAAVRPVIMNGTAGYPNNGLPSYNGAMIDAPNVMGYNIEGCFSNGSGLYGDFHWRGDENGMLMATAHRRLAVCMTTYDPTPANRIYGLASLFLAYDPTYTVIAALGAFADGLTPVPEFDIVPRQPLASATNDVGVLQKSSGVYVREFGACYQAGTAIGPCAAVVNTNAGAAALPPLSGRYSNALVLDTTSAYAGGRALWTGAIPAQLPALGALILR